MTTLQTTSDHVQPGVAVGGAGSRTKNIGLGRLTVIELRKLADTRSGLWLLIVIALGAVGTSAIQLGFAPDAEQTFSAFFTFGMLPAGVLLPVLGILSMTSEWSQRTALTTFTLVPARGRVILAKLAAGVLIACAATAVTAVFAAVANLIGMGLGGDGSWHLDGALPGQFVLMEIIFVLMGLAFGALLLNSPLAIVLFFAIPTVWSILGAMIKSLQTAAGWLDLNLASTPLSEAGMSGGQWARLGVATAVWVVLPLLVGTVRVLRREVS
jgi:ABC-type transport system involved in multi-copper enzyme maturation permease subunit